jgi:MFS transporter, AAHS family, benzoate transport protein
MSAIGRGCVKTPNHNDFGGRLTLTSIGMAAGVGRTGAILAPLLIGLLVSLRLPLEQNFVAIATAGALGAIALAFINHRASASTHHPDAVRDAMPALREVPV